MSDGVEKIYTLQEAAEHMRLPYRVVRDAVFQGRWPSLAPSPRKRLMSASDIQAALESMRRIPVDPKPADVRATRESVRRLLAA